MIELSISEQVRTNKGERWVKVGLSSAHREGETTDQAIERIEGFVIDGVVALVENADL